MSPVAVIDIGKTNTKLALVDLEREAEIAVETTPNAVLPGPPWPHFDTEAQWRFLTGALRRMAADHRVEGITVTTHGACAALLDGQGSLAAPVLDYEHTGPDALSAAYDAIRPPFAETGSPRLPMGLNLGAQLHWMCETDPTLRDRIAHIVTWPQYWGFRLTGELACDVSSLGCHTDLWNPGAGTWSGLPARLGLKGKLAPARKPGERLGTLTPAAQKLTGLGPIPVLTGIHDSNASLVQHLRSRAAPFAVVSTGTWVISMAIGGANLPLDPARDTLINVNALGQPVPSARFMGGREHDLIQGKVKPSATQADLHQVIARQVLLLPSVVTGSGPFPDRTHRWTVEPASAEEREVALGHYLALMTAECLAAIGADGPSLVEGPFVANRWFLVMLATATGRKVIASPSRTGTAVGAAMLFSAGAGQSRTETAITPDPALAALAARWQALVQTRS
jgi:sugar (pentulose or hexulose) kinase